LAQSVDAAEERIAERKTVVYKTLVDPTTVKLTGEKEKIKLFTKMGFLKPKPEEIQCESIEKYYEPYIVVNGKYTIDYYRGHIYTLEVDEDVQELVIFGQVLKPEAPRLAKVRGGGKAVKLETEQRLLHEATIYLILDKEGREVKLKRLPSAPSEEKPEKVLAEHGERVRQLKVPPERAIRTVRSKIVRKPSDAERITRELFEVSEYAVVYTPVYEAAYKNTKTGKTRVLRVDGVTCKVIKP